VIPLVLGGVARGERGDRRIEPVDLAQVVGDRDAVT